jgi:FKBP-type peptidyl-prolyl cis-trans isomerase
MALTGVVAAACDSAGGTAALDTDEQKASYAIGRDVGGSLLPAGERLDLDAFMRGLGDVMEERESALPEEEIAAVLERFSQSLQADAQARQAEAAEKNRTEGAAYLAENAQKEGVQTTASGLQYEVLTPGTGPQPTSADQVSIHYRGTLVDGTEFDSSYGRGEPATFGVTGVIPGFSEGLQLMTVGSKYRFVIPGDLAYGPSGTQGVIGPDATLIFEVELLEIQ